MHVFENWFIKLGFFLFCEIWNIFWKYECLIKLDVWNSTQDSSKYYLSQTKGGQQIKLDLFKLQLNLDKSLCRDKLLPPHQSYTLHSHGQTTSFTLSASLCLIKMPVNSDKSCAYSDACPIVFRYATLPPRHMPGQVR